MKTSIFLPGSTKSFSGETITVIVKANSLKITDEKGKCMETRDREKSFFSQMKMCNFNTATW